MDTTPPLGLTPSGLRTWEKETEKGKRPSLYSYHFVSYEAYEDYREDLELSPYKTELLDGVENPESIDPIFLQNLCKILYRIEKDLDNKANRPDPYY